MHSSRIVEKFPKKESPELDNFVLQNKANRIRKVNKRDRALDRERKRFIYED